MGRKLSRIVECPPYDASSVVRHNFIEMFRALITIHPSAVGGPPQVDQSRGCVARRALRGHLPAHDGSLRFSHSQ